MCWVFADSGGALLNVCHHLLNQARRKRKIVRVYVLTTTHFSSRRLRVMARGTSFQLFATTWNRHCPRSQTRFGTSRTSCVTLISSLRTRFHVSRCPHWLRWSSKTRRNTVLNGTRSWHSRRLCRESSNHRWQRRRRKCRGGSMCSLVGAEKKDKRFRVSSWSAKCSLCAVQGCQRTET